MTSTLPPSDLVIDARAIVKRYGELVAVGGIDLQVSAGVCLGLLGPNGAGKTTTIEILEGLDEPDEGEVAIFGASWRAGASQIRERIGVQLQETKLPEKLTVEEILRLFRSFYRRGREPGEVMELVGLREKRDVRLGKLSGGQKQRLALGCAFVNEPELLFLDEPTTGLDPQARRRVWEIVEEFKARGGTVLLTTHYMDEAERLADRLVIIDRGRIISEGSPRAIIDSLGASDIVEFTLDRKKTAERPPLEQWLPDLPGVVSVLQDNSVVSLGVEGAHRTLPALLDRLRSEGLELTDLRIHRATLEDVFVSLTGRHLRDE